MLPLGSHICHCLTFHWRGREGSQGTDILSFFSLNKCHFWRQKKKKKEGSHRLIINFRWVAKCNPLVYAKEKTWKYRWAAIMSTTAISPGPYSILECLPVQVTTKITLHTLTHKHTFPTAPLGTY